MATKEEIEAFKAFFRKPKAEMDAILAEAMKDPHRKDYPFLKLLKEESDSLGNLSLDDIL